MESTELHHCSCFFPSDYFFRIILNSEFRFHEKAFHFFLGGSSLESVAAKSKSHFQTNSARLLLIWKSGKWSLFHGFFRSEGYQSAWVLCLPYLSTVSRTYGNKADDGIQHCRLSTHFNTVQATQLHLWKSENTTELKIILQPFLWKVLRVVWSLIQMTGLPLLLLQRENTCTEHEEQIKWKAWECCTSW